MGGRGMGIRYSQFVEFYNEAKTYRDVEKYIAERGWQDWMNPYEKNPQLIADILTLIYELAYLDFKGLRKKLGLSIKKFSRVYDIPYRTIENWETGKSICKKHLLMIIAYTIFMDKIMEDSNESN